MQMFESMKTVLNKNELRYLMKRSRFPDDKIIELEQRYHGRDNLPQRVYAAMLVWKELKGPKATVDELIRSIHLMGFHQLANNLKKIKIMSQRLRL
jgi:hypothetical protein